MNKLLKIIIIIFLFIGICGSVSAHPGRTDSNGGHKDNKNAAGLGNYHYHCGGHPPHLHTDNLCPYDNTIIASTKDTEKENNLIKDHFLTYTEKETTATNDLIKNDKPIFRGIIFVVLVLGITMHIIKKNRKH